MPSCVLTLVFYIEVRTAPRLRERPSPPRSVGCGRLEEQQAKLRPVHFNRQRARIVDWIVAPSRANGGIVRVDPHEVQGAIAGVLGAADGYRRRWRPVVIDI